MKYGKLTFGQMEAIVIKLGGMDGVKRLLAGELEVLEKKHIIDCDADPYVLEGWKVVEHQPGEQFEWNPDEIELCLCDEQQEGSIDGHQLRKKMEGKPVLNANVFDFLRSRPKLIPKEWVNKLVFFWGTIYRCPLGKLYVNFLTYDGCDCHRNRYCLDDYWNRFDEAVVVAALRK